MSNAKLPSGGTSNTKQSSDQSRTAVERRRIDIQMVQNIPLIRLDSNIDENNADCRNTIVQLRRAVNTINTYTDGEECVQFLKTIDNDKVCMVNSGSLGQYIVHRISQVDSIFIFCGNKQCHEGWAKDWSKIKGVFTEISPICEALLSKKLDQFDPSFMYTHIFKGILLTIKFELKHFTELQNLGKLQEEYRDETSVWWYTFQCFLYPMLNHSLRLMDVDIMIKMVFFINDLHRLHREQHSRRNSVERFTVYREQGMSKTEFDRMSKTRGGLISFNPFLSTSKDQTVSLHLANSAATNSNLVGVLFVMTIDPSQSTIPFGLIIDINYLFYLFY